ncbi:cyclic nucleotide-gated channel 6 [Rhynchospora pubera]|uniref:Cyclic nucleotide-gated channel 6 n=1 Tax=Rhynchospora pubera TaxID=906938 RepID=A0AAV8FF97_9POAL|nr:cyclic nucleotide-gated channel 6 [Rhynchospora pubera]
MEQDGNIQDKFKGAEQRKAVRFMSPEREKDKKLEKSVNRMLLSLSKPIINNPSQVPSSPKDPTNCLKLILDPGGYILLTWNRAFLMSCFIALCIDPLFFFLPFVDNTYPYLCIRTDQHLACVLTILRCMVDMVYLINIIIKFHTAYVDPISEVLGKGELITDPRLIVNRYLRKGFLIDLLGALPFPQYTIRVYLIIPLSNKIIKVMGFLARTAWAGAIYNLLLYLLASHVVGAVYYLLAMERQATCWQSQCLADVASQNNQTCNFQYLECRNTGSQDSQNWANNTSAFANCNAATKGISFNFGIFLIALQYGLTTTSLSEKYFYSLWWGFQELR